MSPECQRKNLKGLTMVAVGVNKAAEQYLLLDEDTKSELASGKYHDQRRGSFGTSLASPSTSPASSSPAGPSPAGTATTAGASPAPGGSAGRAAGPRTPAARPASRPGAAAKARQPWTSKQARLALLYNEQGLRPDEIAQKLGLSSYAVTQIILTARNRGKL